MITIIHPSRSRPQLAMATAKKWIDRIGLSQDEFEYVLSLDSDDPELWNYSNNFPCLNFTKLINQNKSAIDAINVAAEFYSKHRGKPGDFLIVISDDFDCPEDWGKELLEHRSAGNDWIMKTNDGIQEWIITLPIMSWGYYRRFNYVYHPDYQHCFCDTEMSLVADLLGRKINRQITFIHRPDGPIQDEISKKCDSTFESGRKIFIERKAKNFDLKPEDIKFPMPDNVYTRMQ